MKHNFSVIARKIDLSIGEALSVVINEIEAWKHGITCLDKVIIKKGDKEITVNAELSNSLVHQGEIGITNDIHKSYSINEGDILEIFYAEKNDLSTKAIKKKLLGKKLQKSEIKQLMKDMSDGKLSDTLITYYAACSFCYPSDEEELYFTAKYSAEFGDKMHFGDDKTVVKYSVGGIPGNETTMVIVPILASLGIKSPKTFSKAITSPAATGECVESLMPIKFEIDEIQDIVNNTNGCLAWGKYLNFSPANDKIIHVSYPIAMEAYAKMVVSIISKIYAGGVKAALIEIPVGCQAKITDKNTAKRIKGHFEYIAKRLGMDCNVIITDATRIVGRGIGGYLQTREALRIIQQKNNRDWEVEKKIIKITKSLVELHGLANGKEAEQLVINSLKSGEAWNKLKEITNEQLKFKKSNDLNIYLGAIDSEDIILGKYSYSVIATQSGLLKKYDISKIKSLARKLGCPLDKQAGIWIEKKTGDIVKEGNILFTIYTSKKSIYENILDNFEFESLFRII